MQPKRAGGEQGFTLIELLVVSLIIGVLAAIAIPSFVNQKGKASDAAAKELARTAQTTAEAYASGNNGAYTGLSTTKLNELETTIPIAVSTSQAYLSEASSATASEYAVTVTSPTTSDTFTVTGKKGVVARSCTGTGGGCQSGTW
jgi:type IV pilus assembly protein PilA